MKPLRQTVPPLYTVQVADAIQKACAVDRMNRLDGELLYLPESKVKTRLCSS